MNNQTKTNTMAAVDIGSKVLFFIMTLFVGLVAYEGKTLVTAMHDHEKRISVTEANRYTSSDAITDMRAVNQNISDLKDWMQQQYPPVWLKEDVLELREETKTLRNTVSEMRADIRALQLTIEQRLPDAK